MHIKLKKITTEEKTKIFVERCQEVHGIRWGYSKVIYINNRTKVPIDCPEHGEFLQRIDHHINGSICPKCVGRNKTTEEFITKVKQVHGNNYDCGKAYYRNSKEKVVLICKLHGEFLINPGHLLAGQGCRKCAYDNHYCISGYEKEWLLTIEQKYNIDIIRQHPIIVDEKTIYVDGYCEETNTVYEYNGDYWHGNPKKFDKNKINKQAKKTFGELYSKTIKRENDLKESWLQRYLYLGIRL